MSDLLLDYSEAAARLNTTPRHVRNLVFRRDLAYVKVGRLVRFRAADLERYIESRVVSATTRRGAQSL